jgi:hypothetical protein
LWLRISGVLADQHTHSSLMSYGTIGSNRFDALAQGESPEKRPNTSTTPEAFKLMEAVCIHPVDLGPPAVAVPAKSSIERINGAKRRPAAPPREGHNPKRQSEKDAANKPASAWAKPLAIVAGAGKPAKVAAKIKIPKVVAGPPVKAVKLERAARRSQADNDFLKALHLEAPDLVDLIKKQTEVEGESWYTVELSCAPDQGWVYVGDSPDLSMYPTEKALLQFLAALAGQGAEHCIKMDAIKSVKVEGLARKKFFYQLSCSSEEHLNAIVSNPNALAWKGYALTYYQPRDSRYGYRFQLVIKGLPAPFKDYSIQDWLQVVISQGFDPLSVTYITIGVISIPGELTTRTGMLDIYVKPEACNDHGCDGALSQAGTSAEALGKQIEYPPSQIILGRNTAEESRELIAQGQCVGQYYTDNPNARPEQGCLNAMLETEVNSFLPQSDFGKTFMRKLIKVGSCQHCWGPPHARAEVCMYKGVCRECLAVLADLPFKGFHHSCRSLIVSSRKPTKPEDGHKRKFLYDVGTPANPAMAVYVPSDSRLKRQKLVELLKEKQLKRKAHEIALEAVAAAAAKQAKLDQEAQDLAEFELNSDFEDLDEEVELSAADREAQDRALNEMEMSLGENLGYMDGDL